MIIRTVAVWTLILLIGNNCFIVVGQTANVSDRLAGTVYGNLRNLHEDLLKGYDKRISPSVNQNPVAVEFRFRLLNIITFETATQKLSVLGLFYFFWNDEILSWNPLDYGGNGVVKFPISEVWAPSIALAKSFDGEDRVRDTADVVFYTYDGNATWGHVGKYDVVCQFTIQFYPFDQQSCEILVFVNDAFLTEVVLLPAPEPVATQSFEENTEWKLLSLYTYTSDYILGTHYNAIGLELERRTEFIMYTIISPLILLSVLNVCVFIIPIDSGEKASTAVTIFLSYGVFVSAIRDDLPHNSITVSYLMIYIESLLLFSVFSVIYCFVESWIYANHGDSTINCRIFSNLSKTVKKIRQAHKQNVKVNPGDNVKEQPETELSSTDSNGHKITYKQLMKWIDIIVFTVMLCVALILTTFLFIFLSQRRGL